MGQGQGSFGLGCSHATALAGELPQIQEKHGFHGLTHKRVVWYKHARCGSISILNSTCQAWGVKAHVS